MTTLVKPISQKIYKTYKSRSGKTVFDKKLVGHLIAGVIDNEVCIGYSLVHKNDRYDIVNGKRTPGWGVKLATNRAIKSKQTRKLEVPPSLLRMVEKFQNRCERYYKDLPQPMIIDQEIFNNEYFSCDDQMEEM